MKVTALIFATAALLAVSTVSGCDDKKDDKKTEVKTTDAKKADAKDSKAKAETKAVEEKKEEVKADAKAADAAGAAEKIGIAECDEYVEKYSKCINEKVPEASRKQMTEAMDQSVKAWKEAAKGPGKATLATACKTALDAAKKATTSMGCQW